MSNPADNAFARVIPFKRIHTSPVDSRHQIEVWERGNVRYFIPCYSRTGRTWSNYMSHGQRIACTSYASAMKHIKRGLRGATATPS